MLSWLMLSAAYFENIFYATFTEHYNRLLHNNLVIVLISLMLSVSLGPKVIT
jgi:hypothetical protein